MNISVLRPWIAKKVVELIRIEDDVVVEYVYGMLEDKDNPVRPLPDRVAEQNHAVDRARGRFPIRRNFKYP